ncbi:MAG: NAD(P)-dependent oxidoreductase [Muribaculaceae bacterium]
MAKKILITGAGGFIGGYIVEESLRRGFETWAAVRGTTSREYLTDARINFIELDFSDENVLKSQLSNAITVNGKWDYVVHNLGATKCANFMDFNTINYLYLKRFVDALVALDSVPEGFAMMSSLGAVGIGDETNYTPLSSRNIPNPNTKYGLSKLKAETYLQSVANFPYIIFRPTGVYGPREKDYYIMINSISKGINFNAGFKKQLLTFIYVKDLSCAILDALEAGAKRKAYFIAEDKSYTPQEFCRIVSCAIGKRHVVSLTFPLWLVYLVSLIAEKWGTMRLKPSTLNRDKFNIMKQRNWTCDTSEAQKDFNFKVRYNLADGIKESVDWYKENGWL